jgi:SET domain-containing protein
VGEIINDDVADARRGHYLFNLINSEYTIDGLRYGNKTRFINHSEARPNVIVKTLYVNNEPRIAFYAKRDIPAGTEVRCSTELASTSFARSAIYAT